MYDARRETVLERDDRLVVGVDVDGVLADFVGPLLAECNRRTGSTFCETDIIQFALLDIFGQERWQMLRREVLALPGFADGLAIYPRAREGIDRLREFCRVVFVTAPFGDSPTWVYDRTQWLRRHMNADRKDIVHLWDKSLFGGQILVDDSPEHLDAWAHSGRLAIRMAHPWNGTAPGQTAHNWDDVVRIVENYAGVQPAG